MKGGDDVIDMKTLGGLIVVIIAVLIVVQGFRVTSRKKDDNSSAGKGMSQSQKKIGRAHV